MSDDDSRSNIRWPWESDEGVRSHKKLKSVFEEEEEKDELDWWATAVLGCAGAMGTRMGEDVGRLTKKVTGFVVRELRGMKEEQKKMMKRIENLEWSSKEVNGRKKGGVGGVEGTPVTPAPKTKIVNSVGVGVCIGSEDEDARDFVPATDSFGADEVMEGELVRKRGQKRKVGKKRLIQPRSVGVEEDEIQPKVENKKGKGDRKKRTRVGFRTVPKPVWKGSSVVGYEEKWSWEDVVEDEEETVENDDGKEFRTLSFADVEVEEGDEGALL